MTFLWPNGQFGRGGKRPADVIVIGEEGLVTAEWKWGDYALRVVRYDGFWERVKRL